MAGTPAGGTGPPLSETRLARVVVGAARSVPGVADVSPGRFAEAATYGPGEVVGGVVVQRRAGALTIEIHLCATYASTLVLPTLADRVRDAVRPAIGALDGEPVQRIDVAFDDLRVGED